MENDQYIHFDGLFDTEQLMARKDWQRFRDGIEIIRIYDQGEDGMSAALLRYAPGASVPAHEHTGLENIVVLSGSQQDERGSHEAGSIIVNLPGSRHSVHSENGCIVFIIWERQVRFIE